MFLSKLEILGFKSFARKTVFHFPKGITAIVGPNGCGKTNVVDAIRWVLGEQRAGALRSERMENVIFNGSSAAAPLGMAEVTITLENTRNLLPVEYSEVSVTRRLFRSGESQYLLNGTPCRLKDIQNLFMDTGLTPDAYSVIELPMIETILNGKADERRRILEEAAGVGKYKARRKATFRKLEATEADLFRLDDIIAEVEKNVRSLQSQVRQAERHRELGAKLREKDLLLAGLRLQRILDQLSPLTEQLQQLQRQRERLQGQLELEEAEEESLRAELLEAENNLAELQRLANQRANEAQKLEERLLVLRERRRSAIASAERIQRELNELEVRAKRLEEEREATRQRIRALQKRVSEVEENLRQADEERALAFRRREQARKGYQDAEAAYRKLESSWNRLSLEIEKLQARYTSLTEERKRLENELRSLEERSKKKVQELESLATTLESKREELVSARARLEKATQARAALQEELERLRAERARAEAELSNVTERAQALRHLLQTHEDRPEAVRLLLTDESLKGKIRGTVADFLSAPEDLAGAVEAALGEAAHYLVCDDAGSALEGVSILKKRKGGTISFVALDLLRKLSENRPKVESPGVVAWASDVVSHEAWFAPVAQALLGHVLIVEDWQAAQRVLQKIQDVTPLVVVTRDGLVVHNAGILTGGSSGSSGHHLLNRRQTLEELERKANSLKKQIEQLNADLAGTEAAMAQAVQQLTEAEKTVSELDRAVHRAQIDHEQAKANLAELAERRSTLAAKLEDVGAQVQTLASQIQELEKERQGLKAKLEAAEKALAAARETAEKAEEAAQISDGSYQQIRYETVRVRTELESLEKQLERLKQESLEVAESRKKRTLELAEMRKQREQTEAAIRALEADLDSALERKESAEEKVEAAQRTYSERKNAVAAQQARIRSVREELEQISERIHQLELEINELRLSSDNLKQRTEEAWHVKLEPVSNPDVDLEELEAEVERLRTRLERMGPVNMLAIEEHAKEKERLDFLRSQREDLLEAKENLLETIGQINSTARERFLQTFEEVRKNFTMVFQSFFGGGEADLKLSNPNDPLESDIEIVARPRGKKVASLTLLSGGEKALVALSLLFAIYLVKPSPFCILDEVDAPMDDANVDRFINALRKFSENTQFILVTHNKLTMRAADALYGVTMQRDGVSKVVSVKFEDVEVTEAAA
ncbi:MAG: chromosome segregation protein SMC [Calditrichaeota bacterium]|nr:chromosome segregation protein SMC [Calditrichota bacterium]